MHAHIFCIIAASALNSRGAAMLVSFAERHNKGLCGTVKNNNVIVSVGFHGLQPKLVRCMKYYFT